MRATTSKCCHLAFALVLLGLPRLEADEQVFVCPEPCGGNAANVRCPNRTVVHSGEMMVIHANTESVAANATEWSHSGWDIRVQTLDDFAEGETFRVEIMDQMNFQKAKAGIEYVKCEEDWENLNKEGTCFVLDDHVDGRRCKTWSRGGAGEPAPYTHVVIFCGEKTGSSCPLRHSIKLVPIRPGCFSGSVTCAVVAGIATAVVLFAVGVAVCCLCRARRRRAQARQKAGVPDMEGGVVSPGGVEMAPSAAI